VPRLDQERTAGVRRDGHRDGAIEKTDLAVRGCEIQVNAAAGVEQKLAAVGQQVAAAFAGCRGCVGGDVVQRVEGVADVSGGRARTGERKRTSQESAAGRHDGRGRGRDQRGGSARGAAAAAGGVNIAKPAERRSRQGACQLLPGVLMDRVGRSPRQEVVVVLGRRFARAQQ